MSDLCERGLVNRDAATSCCGHKRNPMARRNAIPLPPLADGSHFFGEVVGELDLARPLVDDVAVSLDCHTHIVRTICP